MAKLRLKLSAILRAPFVGVARVFYPDYYVIWVTGVRRDVISEVSDVKFSNLPRSGRTAVLMRVAGVALVAAVFVGPVAAHAAGDNSSSNLFGGVTSLFGSDSGNPAAESGYGYGTSGVTAGNAGAVADDAGNTLSSVGNTGVGNGTQLGTTVQAPIDIKCNAVGVLGNAYAVCPSLAPAPAPTGYPTGGGYGGGGNGGGGNGGGGYGGGGYGSPTPTPTPTTTVTPTETPTSVPTPTPTPSTSVAGTTSSLPLTGSSSESVGIAGGSMLALGAGLLWLSRPRRRARHGL